MQAILFILFAALGIVQIFAFFEGLDVWLGFGAILSVIAFVVCGMLGPLGALPVTVIGYMGATEGWGWEWWQALLRCAPFLFLSVLMLGFGGLMTMVDRLRRPVT